MLHARCPKRRKEYRMLETTALSVATAPPGTPYLFAGIPNRMDVHDELVARQLRSRDYHARSFESKH
eukprot:93361-Pleurochrysis_carterae.AAC.2